MKKGIDLIKEEREKQLSLGFDAGHDFFMNDKAQLAEFASILADPDEITGRAFKEAYKKGDRIGNLVVAGAFIAAEIDRLYLLKITQDTAKAELLKKKKLTKNEHFLISQFANDPTFELKLYSDGHGIGYHKV